MRHEASSFAATVCLYVCVDGNGDHDDGGEKCKRMFFFTVPRFAKMSVRSRHPHCFYSDKPQTFDSRLHR